MSRNRVTVPEAAARLGVTEQAVRKRVKRGTIPSETEGNRVYVFLDAGYEPGYEPRTRDELLEQLRAENQYLRELLAEAHTRDRENRRLLAAALERIPELEEASESAPPDAPPPPPRTEHDPTGEPHSGTQRRPLWRRLLGR